MEGKCDFLRRLWSSKSKASQQPTSCTRAEKVAHTGPLTRTITVTDTQCTHMAMLDKGVATFHDVVCQSISMKRKPSIVHLPDQMSRVINSTICIRTPKIARNKARQQYNCKLVQTTPLQDEISTLSNITHNRSAGQTPLCSRLPLINFDTCRITTQQDSNSWWLQIHIPT